MATASCPELGHDRSGQQGWPCHQSLFQLSVWQYQINAYFPGASSCTGGRGRAGWDLSQALLCELSHAPVAGLHEEGGLAGHTCCVCGQNPCVRMLCSVLTLSVCVPNKVLFYLL